MIGVIANTVTVLVGSICGLLFARFINEKYTSAIMTAIGLCTIYIGIDGSLNGENTLVLILSLVIGTALGTALNIDGGINKLGRYIEKRFSKNSKNNVKMNIAQAFMTASLLFCVGSMTIVGSLDAGIRGDNTLLFTKSVLDLISSFILASSLGIGVVFASVFVFVFQGALVVLAGLIAPMLSEPAQAELLCVGSVMIIALGLNLIGLTKIKVANMLPALIFAPVLLAPINYLMSLIG